ncbi:unnamed protein product [Linum trigynum]|uniref:C2H2-type domain-containing protein n=1 Tax=Linum trigynum TaxID=586398 RepID=A0AAV2D1N5_9ROSI
MANWKYPRKPTKKTTHKKRQQQSQQQVQKSEKPPPPPPSWTVMKGIFSCRDLQTQQQQQQQKKKDQKQEENKQKKAQKHKKHQEDNSSSSSSKKCKKMRCSVSLCNNNTTTKIVSALPPNLTDLANNGGGSSRSERGRGGSSSGVVSSSSMVTTTNSFRGMPFSRFSGCYECRMVVDPVLGGFTKVPNSLRSPTIWSCPDCPHIFMNPQSLELHQAVTHAVSELGAEDTSKNIVEIIFQSSWLRKEGGGGGGGGGGVAPMCKIDRILKVHNTQSRVSKFEEYRDSIKAKATSFPKKHPRCIADGNELLRFYSANFRCALGLNGSSNLCCSAENVDGGGGCCNACSIIRDGFVGGGEKGILTTATSGRAHEEKVGAAAAAEGKRAMLVCRVIAGRVMKKKIGGGGGVGSIDELFYDSVAGDNVGLYSNLDELYVFNPMAILPCFVVIYGGF